MKHETKIIRGGGSEKAIAQILKEIENDFSPVHDQVCKGLCERYKSADPDAFRQGFMFGFCDALLRIATKELTIEGILVHSDE